MRHFLDLLDLSADEITALLNDAAAMKVALKRGERPHHLAGRVLGLIFEKPSLRTRASFEAAMVQMGGSSIFLSSPDGAIGVRESVADFARTLSQYVDVVAGVVHIALEVPQPAQVFGLERLLQHGPVLPSVVEASLAVAGGEHERDAARRQLFRDRIGALAVQVHIEHGEINLGRRGVLHGAVHAADSGHDGVAEVHEQILDQHRDERLVFHDQNFEIGAHCILQPPANVSSELVIVAVTPSRL